MSHKRFLFLLIIILLFCLKSLYSQISISKIDWQIAKIKNKSKSSFETVTQLIIKPKEKISDKIRILVTLRNNSPKSSIEGIVLKYAINMHITKSGNELNPGIWSVPFSVEESRISKIKPLKTHQVRIIQMNLNEHLKKLRNTGFWVDMLKIQVMLEPKSGDIIENNVQESTITVKNGVNSIFLQ
jgi:hypothetical protein